MNKDHLRENIWNGILGADLSRRYWAAMGNRLDDRDKYGRVAVAATSSTTVASWSFWAGADLVWQFLSAVCAVLAVAMPIFGWSKIAQKMNELATGWHAVQVAYEFLWLDFEDKTKSRDEIIKEFRRIKEAEVKLTSGQIAHREDPELVKQSRIAVLADRKLALNGGTPDAIQP